MSGSAETFHAVEDPLHAEGEVGITIGGGEIDEPDVDRRLAKGREPLRVRDYGQRSVGLSMPSPASVLLGADHASNTSLHLAEHRGRWPGKHWVSQGAPIWSTTSGAGWPTRNWITTPPISNAWVPPLPPHTGLERRGPVGAGEDRLMPQRELVDYAIRWIGRHRSH